MAKLVCFTASSKEEAERIADALVGERMAACANLFPVKSVYWWKGKVEKADEVFVMMKSRAADFDRIAARIKEMHSYELPVVEMLDSKTTPEVEKWIEESLD